MATAELNVFGEYHRRHIRDIKHRKIYALYNSGKMTDSVVLYTNGTCMYNEDVRARDDPRLPAFIALVAPVEVLLVTAAAYPLSPNPRHQAFAGPFCPRRHSRRLSPARSTPTAHAVADGCRSQPNSSRTAKRENAVTRLCRFDIPLGLAGRGSSGQPAIALGGARALRPPRLAASSCND